MRSLRTSNQLLSSASPVVGGFFLLERIFDLYPSPHQKKKKTTFRCHSSPSRQETPAGPTEPLYFPPSVVIKFRVVVPTRSVPYISQATRGGAPRDSLTWYVLVEVFTTWYRGRYTSPELVSFSPAVPNQMPLTSSSSSFFFLCSLVGSSSPNPVAASWTMERVRLGEGCDMPEGGGARGRFLLIDACALVKKIEKKHVFLKAAKHEGGRKNNLRFDFEPCSFLRELFCSTSSKISCGTGRRKIAGFGAALSCG